MDFVFDDVQVLDIEPKRDEKFPEISIIERNSSKLDLLARLSEYKANLLELAKQRRRKALAEVQKTNKRRLVREGSPKIRETVYQSGNRMLIKLYLSNCGKRLQSVGKFRYSTRYLEAAHAIYPEATCKVLQDEIARLLREGYKNMGQYQTEFDVCSWEMDLFGTNDSYNVSCESLDGKLIAKREFNVGDVIFIDKPVVGYVKHTRLQCNYCLVKTLYTVPCAKCCAVFYCSVACQSKDERYHKYECLGFKISFFPSVDDSILVLRMFVNVMEILKRNLLQRQQPLASSTMTAQKLWDILVEDHKHSEDFLKVFQACTCDHFAEDKATYQTLLQKVTLIMYYIVFDNQLVQDYMASWINLNEQWPYKFMESVLLRLLCIAKLNACRFHYDLQFDTSDTDEMNTPVNQDAIFTSEEFIVINNQYYGMYRFQTEMDASVTDHNAIFSLLDRGAVVFRANKEIKKGDALVFNVGSPKRQTSSNCVPFKDAMSNVLSSSSSSVASSVLENINLVLECIIDLQSKGVLFTGDNLYDLLALFDCFTELYQKIPETQSGMVKLFSVINKLEAVYQTARFIPLVLMQDNWMALLLSRGIKMRSIRQDYNDRLVNNLHKMYYQG